MKTKSGIIAIILLFAGCALAAQPNPNATQTERNKALVLDFFRVVFEAENAEAAKDFLAESYIQHNPRVPGGRDGFITTFKGIFMHPKPVEAKLRHPPVAVLAEGDLVTVVWKRVLPDPADKSKTYESFGFDMFRVENGKLAEHWDGAMK